VAAIVEPLDEEALIILTQPRSAGEAVPKLLKMDNVQLEFKQDALKAIAQEAPLAKPVPEHYAELKN